MSIKNKTTKGSVLVFSLIMLSLILVSALAIGAATVIERKSSLASNKSTQGFQVADTGIEIVAKKIREAAATSNIGTATGKTCQGGSNAYVTDSTIGSSSIYFFTDTTAQTPADCTTATAGSVKALKAVGTFSGTTRAVQAPIRNHQAAVLDTTGLVSYWKMDGDTTDSKTSGSIVVTSTITFPSPADQKYGLNSGNFDGTAYITNTLSSNKTFTSFSLEAWFKTSSGGTLAAINSGSGAGSGIGVSGSNFVGNIIDNNSSQATLTSSGVNCSDNNWHFGVLTYDGSVANIYVDGVLRNTNTVNHTMTGATTYERVGVGSGMHWGAFNGKIDEAAFYDRALSAEEIRAHR